MIKKTLVALAAIALSACSGVEVAKEAPTPPSGMTVKEYHIGVSDVLQVSVWRNPDLSISVPVRPDGKISVPLVGDIVAAGKTSEELSKAVAEGIGSFVRNPEVTVIVTAPNSADYLQRVRVTGAVNKPQSLSYQQGMSVLDVILQSGGVSTYGVANGALLYRQTEEGLKVYPVYVEDILEKGKLDTNYELAPSDILTIPERVF